MTGRIFRGWKWVTLWTMTGVLMAEVNVSLERFHLPGPQWLRSNKPTCVLRDICCSISWFNLLDHLRGLDLTYLKTRSFTFFCDVLMSYREELF